MYILPPMSHLAVTVRRYVEQPGNTAVALEKAAGVPYTTLSNILRDSHPRPERLGQLLRVLPASTAADWLIAYLRDDIPAEWADRVEILVETLESHTAHVREPSPSYGPAATARALERLQRALEHRPELGDWLVKTMTLILGPESPLRPRTSKRWRPATMDAECCKTLIAGCQPRLVRPRSPRPTEIFSLFACTISGL